MVLRCLCSFVLMLPTPARNWKTLLFMVFVYHFQAAVLFDLSDGALGYNINERRIHCIECISESIFLSCSPGLILPVSCFLDVSAAAESVDWQVHEKSLYFSFFQDKLRHKQGEATGTAILSLFQDNSNLASFAEHISEKMPLKLVYLILGL